MQYGEKLKGLYVITDDILTPSITLFRQVKEALEGGATIIQLRNKKDSDDLIEETAIKLQELCRIYGALFVLNDKIDLAIKHNFDGLHIGESDYDRFEEIRKNYKGIIGVSCYGDVEKAKEFELYGADYVAFGSFFSSPTKPHSSVVSFEVLEKAKGELCIPICAIGGITSENITKKMLDGLDMVAVISDIWNSENIKNKCEQYKNKF